MPERREHMVCVKFKPSEHAPLVAEAERLDLYVAEYVRLAIAEKIARDVEQQA